MSKNFVVYSSSAGSGKTYTLVKEYISLCLKSSNPYYFSKILAITFTNAAAAEMKERVINTVKQLSEADINDEILYDYTNHTAIEKEEIKQRAGKIYINLLYNYSLISITTIDKFMLKIIRTFSKELYLNNDFETETNNKELLKKAVQSIIQESIKKPEINNLLIKYIQSKLDDEKDWNVENEIMDLGEIVFKENSKEPLQKLEKIKFNDFISAHGYYKSIEKKLLNEIKELAYTGKKIIDDNGIQPNDFYYGSKGIYSYLSKILTKNDFNEYKPNTYVLKAIEENVFYTDNKIKPHAKHKIDEVSGELKKILSEINSYYNNNLSYYNLCNELNKYIYSTALLSEINKKCEEIKRKDNYILISDFNNKIWDIVQHEPVPYIYERIGERYNHLLIDEFQDTSELQWKNLLPLLENNLSKGYYNMLVGDAKQAIYRWRGGKAEQFINIPAVEGSDKNDLLKERESVLRREHYPEKLAINRRSLSDIVDFNNRFFSSVVHTNDEIVKKIFNGHEQEKNNNTGGYVEINFYSKKQHEREDDTELKDDAIIYTINTINKCLEAGYKPSDIAILLRSKKEIALIGKALKIKGFNIYSQESLLLKNSPEVKLLIAYTQFILHPDELFFLYEIILRYHQCNKKPGVSLESLIEQQEHYIKTKKNIAIETLLGENASKLNEHYLLSLPLYEYFIKLCDIFAIDKKNIYVTCFLENIFNLHKKQNTLYDVITWWNENDIAIITPANENSIQLMTIHKSKGLQFPVVIMPWANWSEDLHKQKIWINDADEIKPLPAAIISLAKEYPGLSIEKCVEHERNMVKTENLNLLYVAFTRAEERLYIALKPAQKESNTLFKYFYSFLGITANDNKTGIVYNQGKETQKIKKNNSTKNNPLIIEKTNANLSARIIFSMENINNKQTADSADKIVYGNLVHALIAKANPQKASVLMQKLLLSGSEKTMLKKAYEEALRALKQIEEIDSTTQKIRYEVEITDETGNIYRPDILAEDKYGHITIIDIKTGTEKTTDYAEQLNNYARIIEKTGKKIKKKYLLYTSENKLIEV